MGEYLVDVSAESTQQPKYVLVRGPICDEKIVDVDGCDYVDYTRVEEHMTQHDPEDLDLDEEYHFQPMADILLELHGLGRERREAA